MKAKIAGISKLMEEIAIPSFKLWKSHLCIKFIFWLPILSNSILSTEMILSGIKSVPENKFESLGN